MPPAPPRVLLLKPTLAATVREVFPTALSTLELKDWCEQLGERIEQIETFKASEGFVAHADVTDEAREAAAAQLGVETGELAAARACIDDRDRKVVMLEAQLGDLIALELRVVRLLRAAGKLDGETPDTPAVLELFTALTGIT